MQQILTSIYTTYSADSDLKAALPGGMYFELAPQGTSMAYAVFSLITGRPEYMLGGESFEVVRIQFDIYAATNLLRLAAYEKLLAVFDDARISATGYTPVIMERVNQQLIRDGKQNEIFRAIVEYDGRWSKS